MNCPRCKLPLRKMNYEGVDTDMCDSCWGFFLDAGKLEEVLTRHQFSFSREEQKEILDVRSGAKTGPTAPAPCPQCGQTMKRFHFDQSVHLVIDRCEDHGIWLDTGEIKKVQALAEKSQAIHKLLLKKLGLIPERKA